MRALKATWCLLQRTAKEFMSDRCPEMAAAIAYNVLFSMLPVLALMVAAIGFFLRVPEVRESVVDQVLMNVPLTGGIVVDAVRAATAASGSLTIAGVVALLWAGMGLFGTLRHALNIAWGVKPRHNLFRQRLKDLSALLVAGALLAVSVGGTSLLFGMRDFAMPLLGPYARVFAAIWSAVFSLVPFLITFAVFSILYRYLPSVNHRFEDLWPGALVATVLFEVAKHGFAFYVANFSRYEVLYGALGAVMLFLLWVYVSALILLAGAELAAEWKRCTRARKEAARAGDGREIPTPDQVPRKESHPWPEPSGKAL